MMAMSCFSSGVSSSSTNMFWSFCWAVAASVSFSQNSEFAESLIMKATTYNVHVDNISQQSCGAYGMLEITAGDARS